MREGGGRRVLSVVGCVAAVLLGTGPGTALAQDPGSYRYWSFWEGSRSGESWSYATKGPSVLRPDDGAVLGFRFALSEDSEDAAKPRGNAEFGEICGRTEARKGGKRIAVRIDFGTAAHAPGGEVPPKPRTACAQVAGDASAAEALAAVAKPLRYNSDALLCAIGGYPEQGCGERAGGAKEPREERGSSEEPAGSGNQGGEGGLGPVAGIGAAVAGVAVLALAAVRQTRRRR